MASVGANSMPETPMNAGSQSDHPALEAQPAGTVVRNLTRSKQMRNRFAASGLHRGMWSVIDQGTSALGNVILTLAVARAVQPKQLGAFSIAYVSYFLGLGLMRGLSLEPLLVCLDEHGGNSRRHASGCALTLSFIFGGLLFVASAVTHGALHGSLLALSVCTPGLFLQDACRYLLFSDHRPRAAAANDALWLLLQLAGFLVLYLRHAQSLESLILTWGACAAICSIVGLLQSRTAPLPLSLKAWILTNRKLGFPFAAEFLVYQGSGQLALLLVGAFAGLADLGALRASMALFGPLQVMAVGFSIGVLAEGTRLQISSPRRFQSLLIFYSGGSALLGVMFGSLLTVVPASVGTELVGTSWPRVHQLVPSMTVFVSLWIAAAAPAAGLRVLRDPKRGLSARTVTCTLLLLFALPGAVVWGVKGAVWGFAASQGFGLVLWWWELQQSRRRAGSMSTMAEV